MLTERQRLEWGCHIHIAKLDSADIQAITPALISALDAHLRALEAVAEELAAMNFGRASMADLMSLQTQARIATTQKEE